MTSILRFSSPGQPSENIHPQPGAPGGFPGTPPSAQGPQGGGFERGHLEPGTNLHRAARRTMKPTPLSKYLKRAGIALLAMAVAGRLAHELGWLDKLINNKQK